MALAVALASFQEYDSVVRSFVMVEWVLMAQG
jgi:hypothetical protein